MPRRKMIAPLPDNLGGSPHARFKQFAKALLSVPKSEITPVEETLAKLETQKRQIEGELADVRRELKRRPKA